MFNDANQELERLQKELQEAELSDEEFERFYDDIYDEFGPEDEENEDLTSDLPGREVRNYANGYGQGRPERPSSVQPAHQAEVSQNRPQMTDRDFDRYEDAPAKDNCRGLVAIACLECAGIVGIVIWWIVRFM